MRLERKMASIGILLILFHRESCVRYLMSSPFTVSSPYLSNCMQNGGFMIFPTFGRELNTQIAVEWREWRELSCYSRLASRRLGFGISKNRIFIFSYSLDFSTNMTMPEMKMHLVELFTRDCRWRKTLFMLHTISFLVFGMKRPIRSFSPFLNS